MADFEQQTQSNFSQASSYEGDASSFSESIGVPWRILLMSVVLFGLSVFVYFGLRFGYASYLEARAESIDQKIETLASQVSEEDQTRLVSFYSQLVNLSKVLDRHLFPANFFTFLERNTLGTVYYSRVEFTDDGTLVLGGIATTPEMVTNQMASFEKSSGVQKVILNELTSSKAGSGFNMSVVLDPAFFSEPR